MAARSGAKLPSPRRDEIDGSKRGGAGPVRLRASGAPSRFLLLSLAAILLVSLFAYGGSLRYGFVSDDLHLIVDRLSAYQKAFPLAEAFTQSFWKGGGYGSLPGEDKDYYRPLITLSYALDARLWGDRAWGYHLTNLLLHILASGLVLRLLLRLGVRRPPALAAALLFAAHPLHVTSVAWISGRTDLLCAVLLLAAYDRLAAAIDSRIGFPADATGRPTGRHEPEGGRGLDLRRIGPGLLLYALALFAKEMAIVLPGLLALHLLLRRAQSIRAEGAGPRGEASWWIEVAAVTGVTLAFFLLRAALLGLPDFAAGARSPEVPFRPGVLPAVLTWYWRGFLAPGALQLTVPYPLVASGADPRFLVGLLLLGLHVVVAVAGLRRGHPAGVAAGWIVISLIPVSHLVPLTFRALVAEYWAYIPSIGFVVLVASVASVAGSRRAPTLILAAGVLAGLVYTPLRARPLASETALLRHQLRQNPRDAESWVTLAVEHAARGELAPAFDAVRQAIRVEPSLLGAQLCLGNLYDLSGQPDSAEAAYRREILHHPERSAARVNLADLKLRRGDGIEGVAIYREVISTGAYTPEEMMEKVESLLAAAPEGAGIGSWPRREEELRLAGGLISCLEELRFPVSVRFRLARIECELRAGRIEAARQALLAAQAAGVPAAAGLPQLSRIPPTPLAGGTLPGGSSPTSLGAAASILEVLEDESGSAAVIAARGWAADPGAAAAAREWAEFYHATGRTSLAVSLWRPLLQAGVVTPEELNHVAVLAISGESGSDVASDAPVSDGRVVSRPQSGRSADAERILRMLVIEEPDFPQALLNLGGLAFGAGDASGCELWWGRFLAAYPDRPEAGTVRQKLAESRRR